MPDVIVKNQSELDAALKAARGGEVIKLAAGSYTTLGINLRNFTSAVTIQSLDVNNKALVQSMSITSSSNIVVKDLDIKQNFQPEQDWMLANRVVNSKNVTLDGVAISGGTGDPALSRGIGLVVRDSSVVSIKNSSIDHFAVGLDGRNTDAMTIQNNDFHHNRRDHTNFSEMSNLLIDNNLFTDLYPVNGEHPDNIQFLTSGRAKGSSNITITNNVIMQGNGGSSQGIFMNDENGNLPYTNINIKNNLVYTNGMYHGINVVNGRNVNIDSNTIVSKMDGTSLWIRLDKTADATITNNVTDAIILDATSTNIRQSNNAVLTSDAVTLRKLYDLNAVSTAALSNLIVSGVGFQPPVGSAAASLVAKELVTLAKPASPNLLLNMQFTGSGIVDQSRWSSDETKSAVNLAAIDGGFFQVKTGTGFELLREYSRQLYSLPAFTISFDMKRDSVTAPAGQIMGINQSWGISLRANGELAFTMTNAAGKNFSLVTTGANITDTATHKIALTYDSAKGNAILYVDGVARGSLAMSGSTRASEFWGLYVGSPFSSAFSGGIGGIQIREGALSASEILVLGGGANATLPTSEAVKYSLTKGAASSAALLLMSGGTSTTKAVTAVGTSTLASTLTGGATAQLALASKVSVTDDISLTGDLGGSALWQRSTMITGNSYRMELHHV